MINLLPSRFPGHCPLVLLVYVAWKEGKALGSDEGSVLALDIFGLRNTRKALSILGLIFVLFCFVSRAALLRNYDRAGKTAFLKKSSDVNVG